MVGRVPVGHEFLPTPHQNSWKYCKQGSLLNRQFFWWQLLEIGINHVKINNDRHEVFSGLKKELAYNELISFIKSI